MKKHLTLLLVILSFTITVFSQTEKYQTQTLTEAGYTYETVTNDPLKARIYTLKNGLKVYMTVYKDAPRIQTFVAVKAGSKNDPSNATGLAHYLEHILFKGTSQFGTANWEKEKPMIDKIENLYEVYRKTTDSLKRKSIYHQIDSVAGLAAQYAIANEYDKMLGGIGASGTNAYTYVEQTVYVNEIPSNQIEKWAQIEAERFREVTPRLFHTELEAVYEEKNKGLDNDRRKVWELMFEGLFQKHTYGTQTTIGTIEHLKNPSIKEIKKYFDTYYVPNNMAICLSGDFDPTTTIKTIDKYFSNLKSKSVPSFTPAIEATITAPIVKTAVGPDAESISLAFRFPGNKTREALMVELVSMILSNAQAGLIDLNLNQEQKILGGYSYPLNLNDYSAHILGAQPREGQTLEEVRDLLLSQLELIKQGKFDEWLLKAIIYDYKISKMREFENNKERADAFVTAFVSGMDWKEYIAKIDLLEKISKADIIDFVTKNYSNNYVVIYKRTGTDKNIKKVDKPTITPVTVNREAQSPFYKIVMAQEASIINPVFIDYNKDIQKLRLQSGIEVLYKKNEENEIFNLYYILNFGNNNNPKMSLAIQYLEYLGSNQFKAEELKKEFYKLGCTFGVFSSEDKVYVTLNGLNENFIAATKLFESFLLNPQADTLALQNMVDGILKSRTDAKKSKGTILNKGLVSYAKHGTKSPFTNNLSEEELKALKPEELIVLIKSINLYEHHILYYGPKNTTELVENMDKIHVVPSIRNPVPEPVHFTELTFDSNTVYWVNYDMVQAELVLLSKSVNYNKDLMPVISLYNEYFGGSMSSIVFQEIRESKALAYAVKSSYMIAKEANRSNYNYSYIGTQADKLAEALAGMQELLTKMPEATTTFNISKDAIINTIETERITKANILFNYETSKKYGIDHDIRADVYKAVKNMNFNDIKIFQEKYIKGLPQKILVIGSKDKLNFDVLKKYGKVKELTLKEVFGY